MQPFITRKTEMYIVGMSFYGDPFNTRGGWDEENEIGRVWTRFMKFLSENAARIQPIIQPGVSYEIHVYNDETTTKGLFEVFVGARVEKLEGIPIELLAKTLPAGEYAVFTFAGKEIASDWYLSIDEWIAAAGYQRAYPFMFQYYDERFKGIDNIEESILDVYLPVKPATPAGENTPISDS